MTSVYWFWLPDTRQEQRFIALVTTLAMSGTMFRLVEWGDGYTRVFVTE